MAQAAQNSPYEKSITSVDLSLDALAVARKNLRGLNVNLICAKAEEIIKDLETQRNRFALAFVDLSYSYEPVYHVCKEIDAVILSGGFILLHDWNDVRNGKDPDYRVYHAARDGLKQGRWEFNGCYGCTALYRRI
jgi:predicted O-methyltransferase YrrM